MLSLVSINVHAVETVWYNLELIQDSSERECVYWQMVTREYAHNLECTLDGSKTSRKLKAWEQLPLVISE
jgi:hypothetical protein